MKKINYIDLGIHYGQEIDLFLEQFKNETDCDINIFGVEANKQLFDAMENKYKDKNNIKLFNLAINEKNGPVDFFIAYNGLLGSSVFSSKRNVSNECHIVEGITFNDFIKNNIPDFENSYNIIKMNIEGAEIFVYEDIVENNLFKYINVMCGHPSHDVEKISELDNSKRKKIYYDTIKENNVDFLYFCAENGINNCVNLKEIFYEES